MRQPPVSTATLTAAELAEFRRLTHAPAIAWPTVRLWVVVVGLYLAGYGLAGAGLIPLWLGAISNALVGYWAFSVVHDAIHRSISTNARFNDFVGQTTAWLGAPYVDLRLFRWGHIRHHRFTGGPQDPDRVLNGPAWSLPFRWLCIDLLYLRHALLHGDAVSRPYLRRSLGLSVGTLALFAALVANGYGWHLFWLWFVPSRLIFLTLGFSFFWLPHAPHDTEQAEHFTRATTLRAGHEAWLTPLLQHQNYHLIHHLWPTTPFYRHRAVWQLMAPELRRHELAIQHGFSIRPTIHRPADAGVEGASAAVSS